jgi:hypothetical protein
MHRAATVRAEIERRRVRLDGAAGGDPEGMSENSEQQQEELTEEELEAMHAETLPDREAMSLIAPFVTPPEITLPVEPND